MNRLAFLLAALAAAPLAAQVQPATAFTARLQKLSDVQRRGALRGAIVNSGEPCARIGPVAHQGPYKNLDIWVARCAGARPADRPIDYGLFLGPDGDVQVRTCADLVTLKLPGCKLELLARR